MATRSELLIEANSRGLLVGPQKQQFDEAVRRGLIVLPEGVQDGALGADIVGAGGVADNLAAFPGDQAQVEARRGLFQRSERPSVTGVGAFPRAGEQPLSPEETAFFREEQSRVGRPIQRVLEPALTVATGAVAEPIAGLAGITQAARPGVEPGAGAAAVEATREALTFQPKTEVGKAGLQAVGELLQPVGEALEATETALGDATLESTGSPALAAAAATIPTAIIEAIGIKGGGRLAKTSRNVGPSEKAVRSALKEAAPEPETLKNLARQVFKELDSSGITMKEGVYRGMVAKIRNAAKGQGLSARTTPRAQGAIDDMREILGSSPSLTEIDDLRKVAQGVARTIDPTEAAIGSRIVAEIDDFLDNISPTALNRGAVPANQIGSKYRAARNLWGRARKSELLTEAIEKAGGRASGLENGLRVEFGKIINSKKLSKFFTDKEKIAIRDLIKGDTTQNFAKLIGRFGFSEGRATSVLTALAGVGGGGLAFGGIGAFAVPAIGTVSRRIAQNLTKGKAQFIDSIVRAGNNGENITKAYLTAIPKGKQSITELSNLLSGADVDLDALFNASNRITREAAEVAAGRQLIGQAIGALAPAGAEATQGTEQ